MVGVFPIGVPVFYASLLFHNRHMLNELRLIELTQSTDFQLAMMEAATRRMRMSR